MGVKKNRVGNTRNKRKNKKQIFFMRINIDN